MENELLKTDETENMESEDSSAAKEEAVVKPPVVYGDDAVIKSFLTLSDKALADTVSKIAPALSLDNVKFIRSMLSEKKPSLSCGELRLLEAIIIKRRAEADGLIVSDAESDSIAFKETYADLCTKAAVLYGQRASKSLCLADIAKISGRYMERVGRADDGAPFVTDTAPKDRSITFSASDGGNLLSVTEPKRKEYTPSPLPKDLSVALLLPDGNEREYGASLKKFFRSCSKESYEERARIGKYGIVELASAKTKGMFIDLTRLVDVPASAVSTLTDSYRGRYVIFFVPGNKASLCELAKKASLRLIHFAKTTSDKLIRTGKKHPTRISLPIKLIDGFMQSRRQGPVAVYTASNDASSFGAVDVILKDNTKKISALPVSDGRRIYVAGRIIADGAPFEDTVNATVNSALTLIAEGANRRSICVAGDYELPEGDLSDTGLGETMALILGAYRTEMELATPTAITNVRYSKGKRSLLYTAYAPRPKQAVSHTFTREGSGLYFLAIGQRSDGMPDYNDLRRIADTFYTLVRSNKVLSAVAVTGSMGDAVAGMSSELTASFNDSGAQLDGSFCRGILFEAVNVKKILSVGKTVKVEKEEKDTVKIETVEVSVGDECTE